VLHRNQSELVATQDALLAGMPSDERSALVGLHSNPTPTPTPNQVGLHWENAMLRSEMHACRLSLGQARLRLETDAFVTCLFPHASAMSRHTGSPA
jgi:hypothetical protein